MTQRSRRAFLQATGVALAPTALSAGRTRATAENSDGWTVVDSPTERTLHDIAHTTSNALAVGAGGVGVERTDDGWTLAFENGPAGNGNTLHGLASTDDDQRLWMVGASGAIGEYDPTSESVTDHSAPDDVTNTFTDVAVTGSAGDANVYICDSSGHIHISRENGRDGTWTHHTPGSGAAIAAIDFSSETTGAVVDQNQSVFETTDGSTWTEVETPDLGTSPADIEVDNSRGVVLAGSGTLLAGSNGAWARHTPTGQTLHDVEIGSCGCVHAVGANGVVLHRMGHGTPGLTTLARWFDWWNSTTPTDQNLEAVSLGPPHVAVGAAGTIVER